MRSICRPFFPIGLSTATAVGLRYDDRESNATETIRRAANLIQSTSRINRGSRHVPIINIFYR
jgi:hypothetical protein